MAHVLEPGQPADAATALLRVVELHPNRTVVATLDSALDRELGFNSL
jgi:hypothetical protein